MGVIQLNSYFIGELIKIGVALFVSADDIMQRGGNKKIFLFQSKLFSRSDMIVGIQDF